MDMVWKIFFMFGGVAAMMLGMKFMGSALERVASGGMKKMLGKVTSNRFAGVGVGLAVTSVIQSSTATTVMLVGFVNIGLMTLGQATNVIMGANIGTTVTAHIASLAGIGSIDIGAIAAIIGFIGVMMAMLVKNEKTINIGNILAGLGLIFVGLEFISFYAKAIMIVDGEALPWVRTIFQGDHFPLLLIVIGIVLTALVHSSSTITSLMVVLASSGILTFDNALFLALGSNIGTCITSMMSSIGTQVNAKRTAIVHLLFNLFGCLIFIAPFWIWRLEVTNLFASMSGDVGQQIAIFHTLFNIVTTLILLPFVPFVVKLACLIIPEKKGAEVDRLKFNFIDIRMLETPPIAVENTKKEILNMASIARENVDLCMDILLNGEMDKTDRLKENEEVINFLNRNITAFLTKLIAKDVTDKDEIALGSYYHVVSDIERIGDYCENIMEYAYKLKEEDSKFSSEAVAELKEVHSNLSELYEKAIKTFESTSDEFFTEIDEIEEKIDNVSVELEARHIDRVKKGVCTAQLGSVYLQTVSNLERVGDHITNLAFSIKNLRHR